MTELDQYLLGLSLLAFIFIAGVTIGKACDDSDSKKNWIIAFFDGYLLVIPLMICMTGIGLFLPIAGLAMLIYSIIKFIAGEFVLNDYTFAGIAFAFISALILAWWWFRKKILNQDDLF